MWIECVWYIIFNIYLYLVYMVFVLVSLEYYNKLFKLSSFINDKKFFFRILEVEKFKIKV